MAHTYQARQSARAEIYRISGEIHHRELHWRRLAEDAACRRWPGRAGDCCFGLGKSAETKQLRAAFEEEFERLRPIHEPLILKHRRKIERTRRFFGFND